MVIVFRLYKEHASSCMINQSFIAHQFVSPLRKQFIQFQNYKGFKFAYALTMVLLSRFTQTIFSYPFIFVVLFQTVEMLICIFKFFQF